jgi:hypothetical protein
MLTDDNINFIHNGINGIALVWVIDEDCLYDLPLSVEHANIFLDANEVIDISEEYSDHNGITVRLIKDGNILEDFQTSEYFGSILLSNPQVLKLMDYPYGLYVMSPNAKFIDNSFILTDRDMNGLVP